MIQGKVSAPTAAPATISSRSAARRRASVTATAPSSTKTPPVTLRSFTLTSQVATQGPVIPPRVQVLNYDFWCRFLADRAPGAQRSTCAPVIDKEDHGAQAHSASLLKER